MSALGRKRTFPDGFGRLWLPLRAKVPKLAQKEKGPNIIICPAPFISRGELLDAPGFQPLESLGVRLGPRLRGGDGRAGVTAERG